MDRHACQEPFSLQPGVVVTNPDSLHLEKQQHGGWVGVVGGGVEDGGGVGGGLFIHLQQSSPTESNEMIINGCLTKTSWES